jgi:hypothetical protein
MPSGRFCRSRRYGRGRTGRLRASYAVCGMWYRMYGCMYVRTGRQASKHQHAQSPGMLWPCVALGPWSSVLVGGAEERLSLSLLSPSVLAACTCTVQYEGGLRILRNSRRSDWAGMAMQMQMHTPCLAPGPFASWGFPGRSSCLAEREDGWTGWRLCASACTS